jgi:PhnB protein
MGMKQITAPYINFQGRAREAMEFYQGVFGGKLSLYAADDTGTPREARSGEPVMYARLEAEGVVLLGSDGNPKYKPTPGDNIAIVLMGTDRSALTAAFDKLAEGGQVKGPIRDAPWGGAAGWLQDKFGINWNIDIEKA